MRQIPYFRPNVRFVSKRIINDVSGFLELSRNGLRILKVCMSSIILEKINPPESWGSYGNVPTEKKPWYRRHVNDWYPKAVASKYIQWSIQIGILIQQNDCSRKYMLVFDLENKQ